MIHSGWTSRADKCSVISSFVYDGDGNRVKKVGSTGVMAYVNNLLEVLILATATATPTATPTATATTAASAAGERCPLGARARDGLEFVVCRQ